jgi:hypothetical protein
MALSYEGGILTMDFEVGTLEPADWEVWVIWKGVSVHIVSIWWIPLPAIDPPATPSLSVPFRSFVPRGETMGFLTILSTIAGVTCWDFDTIDIGTSSSSAPSAQELRELFPQPNIGIPVN